MAEGREGSGRLGATDAVGRAGMTGAVWTVGVGEAAGAGPCRTDPLAPAPIHENWQIGRQMRWAGRFTPFRLYLNPIENLMTGEPPPIEPRRALSWSTEGGESQQ